MDMSETRLTNFIPPAVPAGTVAGDARGCKMTWINEDKLHIGTRLIRSSDKKPFVISNIKTIHNLSGKPEKEYELTREGTTASLKSNLHFLGCYWELI
jgi:hypothetical protein